MMISRVAWVSVLALVAGCSTTKSSGPHGRVPPPSTAYDAGLSQVGMAPDATTASQCTGPQDDDGSVNAIDEDSGMEPTECL